MTRRVGRPGRNSALGEETDVRNRDAFREYMTGSLWVLPGISAVLALVAGFILSRVPLDPGITVGVPGYR